MIVTACKLIGGGIASTGLIGSAIGIGVLFSGYLLALSRNPGLSGELFSSLILGFALVEASAIFSLLVAFLIMFGF